MSSCSSKRGRACTARVLSRRLVQLHWQAEHRKHRELLLEVEAVAIARASRAQEIETSGCRPDARRRKVTVAVVPSVEARAVTVSRGACSKDPRGAGGSLVGREHEPGRTRMTGRILVDAVTGDHSTDTGIDVRVTSQPLFLSGRLVQTHLQAEHRKGFANALGGELRPIANAER